MSDDQQKKTSRSKRKKQVETLAWITDDEAEFWTNITPIKGDKSHKSHSESPTTKNSSSDATLPLRDGDEFIFDTPLNKTSENQNEQGSQQNVNGTIENKPTSEISQGINDQTKEVNQNNQTPEIFQGIDDSIERNQNKQTPEIFAGFNNQSKKINQNKHTPETSEDDNNESHDISHNKQKSEGINNQSKETKENQEAPAVFEGINGHTEEKNKNQQASAIFEGINDQSKKINGNKQTPEIFGGMDGQLKERNKNNQTPEISEGINDQSKRINENKKISEENNNQSKEIDADKPKSAYDKYKGMSEAERSFIDQLLLELRQLSRSSSKESDNSNEEQYTEVNSNGTILTSDNNRNGQAVKKILPKDTNINEKGATFIEELGEEKDVIIGALDEETLLNRRSRRAKATLSSTKSKKYLSRNST